MEFSNEYGLDPTKLTKEELVSEITTIGDFDVMSDCIRHLYSIDSELASASLSKVMTTDIDNENYGDAYFQAMFLAAFFSHDEQKELDYIKANYKNVEV